MQLPYSSDMNEQISEPSGVLIIDKQAGCTSHDVVNMVRKAYNTKRVGHTGTLDPMATGVLVVLVGRAAKAAEYINTDRKSYTAIMRLGLTTDTEDITGKVLTESDSIPSEEKVISVSEGFIGKTMQVPPMYSAIKINGKKLYDIARTGETVVRMPREIEIFGLSCNKINTTDYVLSVECSAGTYIRTLCADIGNTLGCGAVMADLRRTSVGNYSIEKSVTVDSLKEMSPDKRLSLLFPVDSLFCDLNCIRLSPFFEKLFRSGCGIYQSKIKTSFDTGTMLRVSDENGHFFALGKVVSTPDGSVVKSEKLFEL